MNLSKTVNQIEINMIIADGGSILLRVIQNHKTFNLFLDKRIGTETYEEFYTGDPDVEDSLLLDSNSKMILDIRKKLKNQV